MNLDSILAAITQDETYSDDMIHIDGMVLSELVQKYQKQKELLTKMIIAKPNHFASEKEWIDFFRNEAGNLLQLNSLNDGTQLTGMYGK